MMFTSVIGALTSLLPKYFIFGSYVPVLIFSFVNTGLVYLFWERGRSGIEFSLARSPSLTIAVAFVGTVVIAYVISAINDFLREFLEGRHLPRAAKWYFCRVQRRHRAELQSTYRVARRQRFVLRELTRDSELTLRDAGATRNPRTTAPYSADRTASTALDTLRELVRSGAVRTRLGDPWPPAAFSKLGVEIRNAVDAMTAALVRYDQTREPELEADRRDLVVLLDAVLNAAMQTEYESAAKLFAAFGTGPVMPTRMGNVSASIHAYTIGRYKMELTVFISRLQTVLTTKDDKAYSLVLAAKAQVDFLVACCWFSGLTTVTWCVLLALYGGSLRPFLVTAGVGSFVAVAFYLLACEAYVAYAEVTRACIDVNRFALLSALNIGLPGSLREERELWSAMSHLAFSGGDSFELSYEHPEK